MPFVTGSTPFGIFDGDPDFQQDADKIVEYVVRKLGGPAAGHQPGDEGLHVELDEKHVYASFEEACLEYSAIVNSYQAKSVLATFLGSPTGSLSGGEQMYPNRLLELQKRLAEPYGEEAALNGPHDLLSASIITHNGQQRYDLKTLVPVTGTDGQPRRMYIKDIFHFSPTQAYRFFGTTSAINYLHNQFSFESFTPETIFYLLPIWEDVLRGMQFKMSNKVRRSNYSYELHNNILTLYPTPAADVTLYFTYTLSKDPLKPDFPDPTLYGVANLSNVPFGNIQYSRLNSMGKQWIRKMAFALSKEVLGQIRGKMSSIPIPNGDLTLNGPELINDARAEQEQLRTDLKEILDETTYDKLIEKEAQISENLNASIKQVPMLIYVG
jgi:hypothetical protein